MFAVHFAGQSAMGGRATPWQGPLVEVDGIVAIVEGYVQGKTNVGNGKVLLRREGSNPLFQEERIVPQDLVCEAGVVGCPPCLHSPLLPHFPALCQSRYR